MSGESKKAVTDYKEQCKEEAEHLVIHVFPVKITELNHLIRSEDFQLGHLKCIHVPVNIPVPDPVLVNHCGEPEMDGVSDVPSKKRKRMGVPTEVHGSHVIILPDGMVTVNNELKRLTDKLKPHIMELMDHANKVKMWISFMIPRIEDGNNFGVSIQEDTLGEARQVESEAASFLDQITRYHIQRAKIIAKVAKYPHVEDYRQSIQELDEKEFITMRLICIELRNQYASLHDIISKNMDKIKKPRSANAVNMY